MRKSINKVNPKDSGYLYRKDFSVKTKYSQTFFKHISAKKSSFNGDGLARRNSFLENFNKTKLLSFDKNLIHDRILDFFQRKRLSIIFRKNFMNMSMFVKTVKLGKRLFGVSTPKKLDHNFTRDKKVFGRSFNKNPQYEVLSSVNQKDQFTQTPASLQHKKFSVKFKFNTSTFSFFGTNKSLVSYNHCINATNSYYVKYYRSKKRNLAVINSFNRVWFRLFFKKFFEQFSSFKHIYKRFLRKTLTAFGPKGSKQKFLRRNFFDFFFKTINSTVFNFLYNNFLIRNTNLALFLIKNGVVSVNGSIIYDPFYKIGYNSIVRFNLSPVFFFILIFSFRRLFFFNKTYFKYKTFFKRFLTNQNIIVNYNLLEFLIIHELKFTGRLYKRTFLARRFNLDVMLYQYFFVKQRRLKSAR
jgi:hypothetical protein